ncbi:nucleotide exchange factor GrpE [Patescibacteria group bacterium]|nr:nucleotide exchange factor GrpE [Patescibacteria group bacterium]
MNSANPPANDDAQNQQPSKDEIDFEEKYLRTLAELENFRKKVEREKTEFAKFANENTLAALLPVLDNFKRAGGHLPADLEKNEWVKGIAGIEKQLEQTLESLGLRRIEVKAGDRCDAVKHEAIATGNGESGKILEVLEEGYELNGKVLRAAKVRVGK